MRPTFQCLVQSRAVTKLIIKGQHIISDLKKEVDLFCYFFLQLQRFCSRIISPGKNAKTIFVNGNPAAGWSIIFLMSEILLNGNKCIEKSSS